MSMKKTVYALGETLIDMVPGDTWGDAGETAYIPKAGGAPANVAACVSKLGGRAGFIGKHGRDAFGTLLAHTLEQAGVETRYYTATEEAKTALAFVTLDASGDRSFLFYRDPSADLLLRPEEVPVAAILEGGMLHIGSISLTGEPSRSATLHAAQEAHRMGAFVSYDPNWRPALWPSEEAGLAAVRELYPYCSLIKVNREELGLLTGSEDLQEGSEWFHRQGIRYVFVTLDAEGCYYSAAGETGEERITGRVPGRRVACVDTTGAGDAFIGALLYKLSLHEDSAPPDARLLRDWAAFAVAASALVTLRKGAIAALPSLAETEAFQGQEGDRADG
ncbi:fructokinase [Paenibacillus sp. J31TS4]|uniref:carbohydrate kinase family protein n=1 Tax=Paenibacillus sp. J31TS4 TaxID=2807195 RepID=UPI001B122478|nr:carbohydrate kinase [Paenibacillus sp. J31TS4]GIP39498.1 fructokinase [Paenibacillus sp. J31TS4]